MKKGKTTVQRRTGQNKIDVTIPKDIRLYQIERDGVDRGDHHWVMGVVFTNVLYLKKMI